MKTALKGLLRFVVSPLGLSWVWDEDSPKGLTTGLSWIWGEDSPEGLTTVCDQFPLEALTLGTAEP